MSRRAIDGKGLKYAAPGVQCKRRRSSDGLMRWSQLVNRVRRVKRMGRVALAVQQLDSRDSRTQVQQGTESKYRPSCERGRLGMRSRNQGCSSTACYGSLVDVERLWLRWSGGFRSRVKCWAGWRRSAGKCREQGVAKSGLAPYPSMSLCLYLLYAQIGGPSSAC